MTDLAEFEKCRWDPVRFARVFLGIRLHPGQKRMVEAYIRRTDSGWRAWVVYLSGDGDEQVAVQCWVSRDRLAPVDPPSRR